LPADSWRLTGVRRGLPQDKWTRLIEPLPVIHAFGLDVDHFREGLYRSSETLMHRREEPNLRLSGNVAAQKALPTIKQHYQMAQQLAAKKGLAE
jgi:hypothetical protein